MTQFPITLIGNSLCERHHHLNSLVNEAYKSSVSLDSIQHLVEASPVDRLFKIDLASKYKNVPYIVKNLKDPDIVFVSRALKSTWLLEKEYGNIINPQHLEDDLFPEMTAKAANKMLHWIQHCLRDPDRCEMFYKYYKETDFKVAAKFLWHCSNEYLLEELTNINNRIQPKDLKVISEKCPEATKLFYKHLEDNRDVISHYLKHEIHFFNNLKFIILPDPETFFYVIEKYFNNQKCRSFSYAITKYILSKHKDRFIRKPELYTVRFLEMSALAESLDAEEVKGLVKKLAKAEYLADWFSFKKVELLLERIDKDERAIFKKTIFVYKAFGEKIKHCPYATPHPPVLKDMPTFNIFRDRQNFPRSAPQRLCLRSAAICSAENMCFREKLVKCEMNKGKILLDELFNQYRFVSFERTLYELRKRLKTESVPQNRQFMMLVLISKSGGREDSLRTLFELLTQYRNEPANIRAAVIRSLVKRACVWRLPSDLWSTLLEWGHGLGLDGSPSEATCDEGFHAVILRKLLTENPLSPLLFKSFLDKFTTFIDYSLNAAERTCLHRCLPKLLTNEGELVTGFQRQRFLNMLLDTLTAFKIPFSKYPSVVDAVAAAARENIEESGNLLTRLYEAKIGRKQLFKENFNRYQNSKSYVNALRHDISILSAESEGFKEILKFHMGSCLRFDVFFRKLIIYFYESGGLAEQYYHKLKSIAILKPNKSLGRSLAILAREHLISLLKTFDVDRLERRSKTPLQSLAAALRANAHLSRPPLDVDSYSWPSSGAKAVANSISRSPKGKLEEVINKLVIWKRTVRVALALTKNEDKKYQIYKTLVELRPGTALKLFLLSIESGKNNESFVSIWNVVKQLIIVLDYTKRKRQHMKLLSISYNTVPSSIRAEYFVLVYQAFRDTDNSKQYIDGILYSIENACSEIDETFFFEDIKHFLESKMFLEIVSDDDRSYRNFSKRNVCSTYMRLIAKYLLLCNSEDTQQKRLKAIGIPFFDLIEGMWRNPVNQKRLLRFINDFLSALFYNKVFFDVKYVSCTPVFQKILEWMQRMLPIEEWFSLYVHIHLTMLYSKAARHCVAKKPELFSSEDSSYLNKAVEIFGFTFGKFVAHEYEELKEKYFQSIRNMYKRDLCEYFRSNFYSNYDESYERFVFEFMKSVLGYSEVIEGHFLAYYVLQEFASHYFRYGCDTADIVRILENIVNFELRTCIDIDDEIHKGCFKKTSESVSSSDLWTTASD